VALVGKENLGVLLEEMTTKNEQLLAISEKIRVICEIIHDSVINPAKWEPQTSFLMKTPFYFKTLYPTVRPCISALLSS
jgi:hypothetical protein